MTRTKRPVATDHNRSFISCLFDSNVVTGDQHILRLMQLQLEVQSLPVGLGWVASLFEVHRTGAVNTSWAEGWWGWRDGVVVMCWSGTGTGLSYCFPVCFCCCKWQILRCVSLLALKEDTNITCIWLNYTNDLHYLCTNMTVSYVRTLVPKTIVAKQSLLCTHICHTWNWKNWLLIELTRE